MTGDKTLMDAVEKIAETMSKSGYYLAVKMGKDNGYDSKQTYESFLFALLKLVIAGVLTHSKFSQASPESTLEWVKRNLDDRLQYALQEKEGRNHDR